MSGLGSVRATLARLSPRRRRYQRMLDSCAVVPEQLPRPVAAPGDNDLMVCGCPRSGTALAAAFLHQPPVAVSVMEPWDGLRMAPAELFAGLRAEVAAGTLSRGRLDLDELDRAGAVRWQRDGERTFEVETAADFVLSVKWPDYWRYLPVLEQTRFIVCVRDPREVVQSFAEQAGTLRRGLGYDVPMNRPMNRALLEATDDDAVRRVLLHDWITERILPHLGRPEVFTLRYERWFDDRRALVAELEEFVGAPLDEDRVVLQRPSAADPAPLPIASRTAGALGYG